ncbi:MAG: S8 family serine peptidase [Blastocatellia bacterium]|nr:S8 family serine peptidase [Blastocatellia bacterium]
MKIRFRTLIFVSLLFISLTYVSLYSSSSSANARKQQIEISSTALHQIEDLLREKASRSNVEKKIGSQLLYALKASSQSAFSETLRSITPSVDIEPNRMTTVDIRAEVSELLLRAIEFSGGEVVASSSRFNSVRARVRLEQVARLAELAEVDSIKPATLPQTDFQKEFYLKSLLPDEMVQASKLNTSEGDIAHQANLVRERFKVAGAGVKVGILSDSIDHLSRVQQSGDLPPVVTVLAGQAATGKGFSGEGTAMLEIVHDLAPDAELFFATAFNGLASFADNILALRAAGCDIIVDDVRYLEESPFQDGVVAQAVDQVVADGALYFASAGNAGNKNDNTSGVWEGDFLEGQRLPFLSGGSLHDFGEGVIANPTLLDTSAITLFWSDPDGASSNDYDLFVLNEAMTAVRKSSTEIQDGDDFAFEIISGRNGTLSPGDKIVIFKTDGAASRFLHLNTNRGRLKIATDGQARGHSATTGAIAVAAVNVLSARDREFIGGSANPVESFSSDGPRRVFFTPNGSSLTPENLSSTGGIVRPKQDIAAADGVSCATPGFSRFFGTSAAAPHAAAIAALIKSANLDLKNSQIKDLMMATALDIESPGFDRDSGVGIVMPLKVLENSFTTAELSQSVISFFGQPVGSTSQLQQVKLTNRGSFPMQISQLEVSEGFLQDSSCSRTLLPGMECDINLKFSPSREGVTVGQLLVKDSGVGSPRFLRLVGSTETNDFALRPELAPRAATLNVVRGQSGTFSIKFDRIGDFHSSITVKTPDTKGTNIKITPAVQSNSDTFTFNFKIKKKAEVGEKVFTFIGQDSLGRMRSTDLRISIRTEK